MKKKCKKIFLMVLSAFMLSGLFSIVSTAQELSTVSTVQGLDQSRQVDPGRPNFPFTHLLPANHGTIATAQQNTTTHGNHRVHLNWPGHSLWARIITGTNSNPGAFTNWQSHPFGQFTTRTHSTGLRAGVGIRVQMMSMSHSAAFTVNGSFSP